MKNYKIKAALMHDVLVDIREYRSVLRYMQNIADENDIIYYIYEESGVVFDFRAVPESLIISCMESEGFRVELVFHQKITRISRLRKREYSSNECFILFMSYRIYPPETNFSDVEHIMHQELDKIKIKDLRKNIIEYKKTKGAHALLQSFNYYLMNNYKWEQEDE